MSSSEGEARPLFRPIAAASRSAGDVATRRKSNMAARRTATVEAALLGFSSDEDMPRARRASALANLRRGSAAAAEGDEGGGNTGAQPQRKKRGAGGAPSRAKVARLEPPSSEDEGAKAPPTVEDALSYLKAQEDMQNKDDQENQEGAGNSALARKHKPFREKAELKRREPRKGGQTKVILDTKKASPDKPDENTPEKEARLRLKSGGGKGKGKGKNNGGDGLGADSDEEEDDSVAKEQLEAWEADLAGRIDPKHPDVAVTAFSIKPCESSAIRRLTPASFLGNKRPEEGGYPLMDADGSVNVHFLLGTHKQLQKIRERQQRGDKTSDNVAKADIKYLRWLVIRALKLRVINKRELRQGKVKQDRVKNAEKTFRWSLARPSNLAEFSDNEVDEDDISPELKFKVRQQPADFKEISERNRLQLKNAVAARKTEISASSSHNIDLEQMQDRLTAPSMSFDWEEKGSDDEGDNLLEVDVPVEETFSSRREIFREQMSRASSFHQAKGLTHRDRTKSNLSRSFSANELADQILGPAPVPQEKPSATPGTSASVTAATPKEAESLEKAAVSVLWEALEAEPPIPASQPEMPSVADVATVIAASSKISEMATDLEASSCAKDQKVIAEEESTATAAMGEQEVADANTTNTAQLSFTKAPASEASFDSITPTQAWAVQMDSIDSTACAESPAKLTGEQHVEISQTQPFLVAKETSNERVEISQTQPFVVAKETARERIEISQTQPFVVAKQTPTEDVEISQTQPFVVAKTATKEHVEISQTQAFVVAQVNPKEHVAISQTQAFSVAKEAPKDLAEISPTLLTGTAKDATCSVPKLAEKQHIENTTTAGGLDITQSSLGDSRERSAIQGLTGSGDLTGKSPAGMSLQRSASLISEDSPSEDESDTENLGDENGFRQDPKQRKREREWLQHKRRAARQEARNSEEKVKKRKVEKSQDFGSSVLSTQDRSRFETDIDTKLISSNTDDSQGADVFGAFGGPLRGIQKKKSIFMK